MAVGRRFTLSLDDQTVVALRRLAQAEERSMSAQLRILIRQSAQERGLWTPKQLQTVSKTPQ